MIRFLTALLPVVFLLNCSTDVEEKPATGGSEAPLTIPAPAPAPVADDGIRYAWVDYLNLRDAPSTQGKVLSSLRTTDRLSLTGKESPEAESVILRGKLYREPWYEVTTEKDRKGWVFGGALKKQDEKKGNPPLSVTRFNYPYFGDFDLSRWEERDAPAGEESGDYAITRSRYEGDGQVLDITEGEGEYGYYIEHALKNQRGQPLKTRLLLYDNNSLTVMEKITDYMERQPVTYRRSLMVDKPYQALKGKILLLDGAMKQTISESLEGAQ